MLKSEHTLVQIVESKTYFANFVSLLVFQVCVEDGPSLSYPLFYVAKCAKLQNILTTFYLTFFFSLSLFASLLGTII